ncbi:RES family NAD+ phosphorylase [Janthinobacterium lividum]
MPSADLWGVAEKCNQVLETFYEESSQTMAVVHFGHTPAGEDLSTTIQELALVSEFVATDIVDALHIMWYDRDSGESKYGDDDPWFVLRTNIDSPLFTEWTKMEISLRSEARYINPKVAAFMESIFGEISNDRTGDGTLVLVNAGPSADYKTFYRARVFQSDQDMSEALQYPEKSLGCPPSGVGSGGRMNAAGLPAFYGATNAETALAEVRPPVGSSVVVAKFSVVRPLKLLDLKLLSQVQLAQSASLFDEATEVAAQRRDFLRMLSERMTLPVMPEKQDRNYLITQVVADYLAMHPNASIDGIIYPSVQVNEGAVDERSENIVLFHKAATAINADSGSATAEAELWEYEEDGPGEYFNPKILYKKVEARYPYQQVGFHPKPALQLVSDSIEIHRVLSVRIRTDPTSVVVVNDQTGLRGS